MATIDGLFVKELHCKNDDCRKLLGYEHVQKGILVFVCPRCNTKSIFRIRFPRGEEIIETLKSMNEAEKGGEI